VVVVGKQDRFPRGIRHGRSERHKRERHTSIRGIEIHCVCAGPESEGRAGSDGDPCERELRIRSRESGVSKATERQGDTRVDPRASGSIKELGVAHRGHENRSVAPFSRPLPVLALGELVAILGFDLTPELLVGYTSSLFNLAARLIEQRLELG
jgi:hypothetical protein